jgi:hypothetical protein
MAIGQLQDGQRGRGFGRSLLIVGAMRSGTSWVSEVLGRTAGVSHLHEPDNPWEIPYAARAMVGLGALPVVEPESEPPAAYARLWDVAFGARSGGVPNWRRSLRNSSVRTRIAPTQHLYRHVPYAERRAALEPGVAVVSFRFQLATRLARPASVRSRCDRVVKSVYAALALEWILRRYDPQVLVVRRHPLDVLASQVTLGWGGDAVDERGVRPRIERWSAPPWPEDGDAFDKQVWLVGFTLSVYEELLSAHPEFFVVDHEELCRDPLEGFRTLAADTGLVWSPRCERYLRSSDRPGQGMETKRVAAEQSGKWRTVLSEKQVNRATETLSRFPIACRYAELSPTGRSRTTRRDLRRSPSDGEAPALQRRRRRLNATRRVHHGDPDRRG